MPHHFRAVSTLVNQRISAEPVITISRIILQKAQALFVLSAVAVTLSGCGGAGEGDSVTIGANTQPNLPSGPDREIQIVGGNEVSEAEFQSVYPFLTQLGKSGDRYVLSNRGRVISDAGQFPLFGGGFLRDPVTPLTGELKLCAEWQTGFCNDMQEALCGIVVLDGFALSPRLTEDAALRAVNSCAAGGAISAVFIGASQSVTPVSISTRNDAAAIPAVFFQSFDLLGQAADALLDPSVVPPLLTLETAPPVDVFGGVCGASYLGGNWVLTAAHCVRDAPFSAAAVGVYSRDEALNNQRFEPSEAHFYFDLDNFEATVDRVGLFSDYALVRLQSPPQGVAPVRIASPDTLRQLQDSGAPVFALGWGFTREGDPVSISDVPRIATQNLVPIQQCNTEWENHLIAQGSPMGDLNDPNRLDTIESELHVCAIANPVVQDACQGDSGGPLLAMVDGEIQLVGITSFGEGCADPNAPPAVYANTTSIIPWVEAVTGLPVRASQASASQPEMSQDAACIDTDGDGWGWNGSASCRPLQQNQNQNQNPGTVGSVCIDTDGDGWGWDGSGSCRPSEVTLNTVAEVCIDTDGDGWGWTGQGSCRVEDFR